VFIYGQILNETESETWVSHSNTDNGSSLLGCYTTQNGEELLRFEKTVVSSLTLTMKAH